MADLPGPRGLPFVGHVFQMDKEHTHLWLKELSTEYGPVFRLKLLDSECVFLNTIRVVNEAMVTRDSDDEIDQREQQRPRFVDIQPHQFDPVGEEEVSEDDGEPRESREQIMDEFKNVGEWCQCGKCQVMPTRQQNTCCLASKKTASMVKEGDLRCICDHEYVDQLLQPGPLSLEYARYLHNHNDLFPANPTEADKKRKQRFCSYRILVFWMNPELKRRQRRPLTACLYSLVQARYPPTDDEELFADWRFSEYEDK